MAGAALLRSAASKIGRTPRGLLLQEHIQHHGRRRLGTGPEPSNRLSSYSTSTNHKGPQTHNKKVTTEWDWAKAAAIEVAPKIACSMALGSCMFMYFWVNPALDRMKDSLDAINIEISRIDDVLARRRERVHGLLTYKEKNQTEATDLAGQGKETDGQ